MEWEVTKPKHPIKDIEMYMYPEKDKMPTCMYQNVRYLESPLRSRIHSFMGTLIKIENATVFEAHSLAYTYMYM